MSDPSTTDLLHRHTDLVLASLARMDAQDLRASSRCPDWTRGHVVSHLARNADALSRAVRGLVEGSGATMYDSNESRDREIDEGADRPVRVQIEDVRATAATLRDELKRLRPEHDEVMIERTPGSGTHVPGGVVGLLRLNEVVLHHIDLDLGFGFADVDDETADRLLGLAVATGDPAHGRTLRSTEGDEHVIGDGALLVRGDRRGILAYLTRQLDEAVTVDEGMSTMTYDGKVSPGDPAQVRELDGLTIRKLAVSQMSNDVYLLTCTATGKQLLIDAADEPEQILALVEQGGGGLAGIVTTHQHWDHVRALEEVASRTGAPTYAGSADADALPVAPDHRLDHGDTVEFGDIRLKVIGVRGHTPGGIALAWTEPSGTVHLFTGDSLFPGGVGATDRYDYQSFPELIDDVEHRIFDQYGDDTWFYPGHGDDGVLGTERPHLPEWRARGW